MLSYFYKSPSEMLALLKQFLFIRVSLNYWVWSAGTELGGRDSKMHYLAASNFGEKLVKRGDRKPYLLAFKKPLSPISIGSFPCQHARNFLCPCTLIRSNKATRVYSFSSCFSLIFLSCLYLCSFLLFILNWHPKCKGICELSSCF